METMDLVEARTRHKQRRIVALIIHRESVYSLVEDDIKQKC